MKTELVFIPGFMGLATDFDTLINHLPKSFHCRVLRLPSELDDTQSFEQLAVRWFYSQQNRLPSQYILYGYSMGGRIALAIANALQEHKPQQLKSLLLESTHPGLADEKERAARLLHDQQWAGQFEKAHNRAALQAVLNNWYKQPVFSSLRPEQINQLVAEKCQLAGPLIAKQLRAFSLGKQQCTDRALTGLDIPVVYFSGKQDTKFSAIGQSMAIVTHLQAENAGHNIHLEQPQWLATQIATIFNGEAQ